MVVNTKRDITENAELNHKKKWKKEDAFEKSRNYQENQPFKTCPIHNHPPQINFNCFHFQGNYQILGWDMNNRSVLCKPVYSKNKNIPNSYYSSDEISLPFKWETRKIARRRWHSDRPFQGCIQGFYK